MSVINKISYYQNRSDEIPNQELAKELAVESNKVGIKEIAGNLWNENSKTQANCIKVLYEIGYLKPELVADYAEEYLQLLHSKNNRMVWSGMIALSTIAEVKAEFIFTHFREITEAIQKGSVITKDAGILALSNAATKGDKYNIKIFPFLIEHLTNCRPKDIPQHSEKIVVAVNSNNKYQFVKILKDRFEYLNDRAKKRVEKVIKTAENN